MRVRPGMLPATITVAPNSPSAREKPRMAPASTNRRASGRLMLKKMRDTLAPSVAATCSKRSLTCSKPARTVRTNSGKPITVIASTTAFHVKRTSSPPSSSQRPTPLRRPERTQQNVAGGHWRQDERQRHQGLDQRLAGKAPARQDPAEREPRRHHQRRRRQRRRHREPGDGPELRHGGDCTGSTPRSSAPALPADCSEPSAVFEDGRRRAAACARACRDTCARRRRPSGASSERPCCGKAAVPTLTRTNHSSPGRMTIGSRGQRRLDVEGAALGVGQAAVADDGDELVAGPAGAEIGGPQHRAERPRHLAQHACRRWRGRRCR